MNKCRECRKDAEDDKKMTMDIAEDIGQSYG